jgi:putative transposase
MDGSPEQLAECGVLSAPDAVWELAVQRAAVISRLAQTERVGVAAADAAETELGISRRLVYALVRRWREGSGLVSDLIVGRSSGGRGGGRLSDEVETVVREALRSRYLGRQRRSLAAVHREVARACKARGVAGAVAGCAGPAGGAAGSGEGGSGRRGLRTTGTAVGAEVG